MMKKRIAASAVTRKGILVLELRYGGLLMGSIVTDKNLNNLVYEETDDTNQCEERTITYHNHLLCQSKS